MVILKCKKCGGNLEPEGEERVVTCEYCGAVQTIPTIDDEKKIKLFARANRLRFNNEFDAAIGVYESIIADFPEEAEAYWGLILSKYGIEYVDDPITKTKIPTCHRSSFTSLLDDEDYQLVLEYSDPLTRKYYREEAKQIEELRKSIIEISNEEEPYDIFICYKETDEDGSRTLDSTLGYDLYTELTNAGYRVFFSRVSLEDKLGKEYEPYIFAALHSAKIMLAIGTDYEYFNSVWVKNEWGRFLSLIAAGEKKTLIPCYKGIDAYDMPREFHKLQAQDLGKIGASQDILHGIKKLLGDSNQVQNIGNNSFSDVGHGVAQLIKRIELFLEDGEFTSAEKYCETVLDQDPANAYAYYYKFLAINKISAIDKVDISSIDLMGDKILNRAMQFGDEELRNYIQSLKIRSLVDRARKMYVISDIETIKKELQSLGDNQEIREGLEKVNEIFDSRVAIEWKDAVEAFEKASSVVDYIKVEKKFLEMKNYSEAQEYLKKCQEYTADWRMYLEPIIKNPEQFSNAGEVYQKIKSFPVFNDIMHKSFMEKLENTVTVERFYGNKKNRILNEVNQYFSTRKI